MSESSGSDNDWFGEVLKTCDAYLSRVILTDKNGRNCFPYAACSNIYNAATGIMPLYSHSDESHQWTWSCIC
jgi:hypothetical protein